MDINGLPDDLLVKILSFLPTKVAISTCVLSKRWEFLWMWLPNLEFECDWDPRPGLGDFINKKLPLHRAPVIETLRLHPTWNPHIKPEDIKRWIEIAVSRQTYFQDVPGRVCLPSLKNLQLQTQLFFEDGKSLQQLLSGCPVLEDLSVQFPYNDNIREEFTITIPSLKSLSLFFPSNRNLNKYEINTPSLKYWKLVDWNHGEHYSLIKNMPNLSEAYFDVGYSNLKILNNAIGPVTSVKRLTICSEVVYGDGFVFNHLEHLNLCVCKKNSSNLLGQLLKGSSNLRVLDISIKKWCLVCWNQPSSVPGCLLSSLQIFNWSGYFGRPRDRDIAVYILKNACHLKKATILADTRETFVTNLQMIKELTLCPRASSTCQLIFPDDFGSC
ncbi:unnamed protein product [Arabidopsis halleri]